MSELNLPEPANWVKAGKPMLWAGLVVSVGMVYFVVRGILAGLRGNYLTTILIFGFVTFPVLMMAALLLAAAGKTRTRTSSDATGFTVWPDKRFSMLYLTGLAAIGPSALLLAFFIPRGAIDLPMSRGLQIFSPALFIAAAVLAVIGIISWVRRGGVGYLKFSPAMIEIADVIKTRAVEWDDIVDVKDHSETKDGKNAGRSVVLCLRDGSEKVIGGLSLYVPTGVPLYWMVRHYWRHPEDRAELMDSRASERLCDGQFDLR
ncbi:MULTISPECIES: hypothetical protein [Mycobacterium]|uniref:Uncharacterized protein n=1 Tax=Mycobacterium syngnathidarum TaxID=1908205 RepID=A0A1S1JT29_9MYCO|nr:MULTISPECIES: hypothetical protein [Mycobacterium]MCG7607957.1 hypothetical protein [Mycobacterium sp. CnD-18-1]OHT90641.1 hypothetical protein BKG61_27400 [Mycobacterium syngnathidarum]OLT88104.1 hypothetical protein BKG60_27605 [Mycobacterium syngnathidarum]TMS48181.1 hypothetical protein E0T84_27830 [Mycobacterium sp. DBP42]